MTKEEAAKKTVEFIKKVVEQAPPLTAKQIDTLRRIFNSDENLPGDDKTSQKPRS